MSAAVRTATNRALARGSASALLQLGDDGVGQRDGALPHGRKRVGAFDRSRDCHQTRADLDEDLHGSGRVVVEIRLFADARDRFERAPGPGGAKRGRIDEERVRSGQAAW